VAVTGYVPTARPVEVVQLVAGSVAVHSCVAPEVNATEPVALLGRPVMASVSAVPYVTDAGVAVAASVPTVTVRLLCDGLASDEETIVAML
jgi:hypothetical protein